MKPIAFTCVDVIPLPPEQIAGGLLDLALWPSFQGYGPLPGIRVAEFEMRTPDVLGTRILVTESNGGTHVETIIDWDPGRRALSSWTVSLRHSRGWRPTSRRTGFSSPTARRPA